MKDGSPAKPNHPWKKNATLPRPSKTEEDIALERFEDIDDRLDRELEKQADSYGADSTW